MHLHILNFLPYSSPLPSFSISTNAPSSTSTGAGSSSSSTSTEAPSPTSIGAPIFFLQLHRSNIEPTSYNTFFNPMNMGIAVLRLKRK
ncbi:hypothetical protein VIGAN_02271600 [Vigna angularis var. angularis]|uniref:Uncharacterized protein n=1 Tax=Vigna angularis var. angularis TaxID=157739 RepID=A0A0S3RGK2_PHAAN|nr:hypothetical protein VIGAN_02271600 [Vigna angularis var. angularis]